MKAGLGVFIFIGAGLLWWGWVRDDNPNSSWKMLVLASIVTVGGIYVLSSKRIGAALKEADIEFAIEEAKNKAEEAKKKEAFRRGGIKGVIFGVPDAPGAAASPSGAPGPGNRDGDAATPHGAAAVSAVQAQAVADPATSKALQDLSKLLYTRAITDEEYQSAKDKLFVSHTVQTQRDTVEQLQQLAQLHESGILGNAEFRAAKLRVLGFD